MRIIVGVAALLVCVAESALAGAPADLVRATVRISNPQSVATGFLLVRPAPQANGQGPAGERFVLVTADHVLDRAQGDETRIDFRRAESDGSFTIRSQTLRIRKEGRALWTKHPQHDVAVIPIDVPLEADVAKLPLDSLATAEDIKGVEPGDLLRCVCYPHAAVFEPNAAAFPTIRLGCVASYPVLPLDKNPTFLADYNTFEGDSGGLLFWKPSGDDKGGTRIIGLIHGQHWFNQRFDTIYHSGEVHKQLGLAIVIQAPIVRETIDRCP
jgi:hypothetical protein